VTGKKIGDPEGPPIVGSCRSVPEHDSTELNHARRPIFLFEHDLFGKPVPTFPDHALDDPAIHHSSNMMDTRVKPAYDDQVC
jgi:hypothetical protein